MAVSVRGGRPLGGFRKDRQFASACGDCETDELSKISKGAFTAMKKANHPKLRQLKERLI